jgi:hypothetical protein
MASGLMESCLRSRDVSDPCTIVSAGGGYQGIATLRIRAMSACYRRIVLVCNILGYSSIMVKYKALELLGSFRGKPDSTSIPQSPHVLGASICWRWRSVTECNRENTDERAVSETFTIDTSQGAWRDIRIEWELSREKKKGAFGAGTTSTRIGASNLDNFKSLMIFW